MTDNRPISIGVADTRCYFLPFSTSFAKEEQGLDELSDYIKTQYISGNINDNSDLIISNIRHKDLLSESYESLKLVINGIDNMISEDFLTIDLVNAYECLGRIIGEEVSDDVIKEVFEKFCMGK